MLIDSRTVELTRAFYDWELRGRGWARYPHLVVLEPPFQPFFGHGFRGTKRLDDGRRHTWLSSLVEQLRGPKQQVGEEPEAVEEPLAEPDGQADGASELEEFLVALPGDASIPRSAVLGWLRSLSTSSGRTAFELLGGGRRVEVRLALRAGDAPHVLRQLRAAAPAASVTKAPQTLEERWSAVPGRLFAAVEFGLASEFMVPLSLPGPRDDPLLPLIAALGDVEAGELGLVQVLFEETRQSWAESILRAVVTPGGKPFFADAPEITERAKEKVSSPLFAVAIRVAGVADDPDRAWNILRRVAGGLSQFGNPQTNELMPLPNDDPEVLQEDLLERTTHRSGMLLSAAELASLLHLPGAAVRVPELWRAVAKTRKAPREVLGAGCLLGRNDHEGETAEIRLPVEAKTKHVHVVGSSGTGKSTLLVRMILEDLAAGHGVGVLDPHGDLIDEVAARVPDDRLSDVVLFDPSDEEAAIGWNILRAESEVEKDLLASDLVGVFRRLSTSWGDQMTAVLANAILVFLESERGGTLVDLRRFLVDERFRREILGTVADPEVTSFWETEFPLLVGRRPQAPILTRLDTFLRSRLVRNVVTVRDPKLDFREVVDEGRVFLGKLAVGAIGEENASLLGSLLVSKFHQVTLARQARVAEERRPFFLYIDEFHQVATASMASLFSGARKFRLGVTVAHQDLYQLHSSVPEVERAVLANAYTRICFRLGTDDARQLERGFGFFTAQDLMGLGLGEAICRVGPRDADFNLSTEPLEAINPREAQRRRVRVRDLSRRRWGTGVAPKIGRAPVPLPGADGEVRAVEAPADLSEEGTRIKPDPASNRPSPQKTREPSSAAGPRLDKAALDYLHHVAHEPFLGVRERNRSLGLSSWKGDRLKYALVRQGLVSEAVVNPGGRGTRFKLLELTEDGRRLLAAYGVSTATGHGRGGVAHRWWVNTIASWLKERGFDPMVEDASEGARVDISFSALGVRCAIEVEIGEGHAAENIRKDVSAGYERVVCLLDNPAWEGRIKKKLGKIPAGVLLGDLRAFGPTIAPLLPMAPPLRGPSENKEPRRPRRKGATHRGLPVVAPALAFEPGALSTPAAAEYLGLSPATLETLRCRGGGPPFVKLGRRVVYKREDLDEWIERGRRISTSDTPST